LLFSLLGLARFADAISDYIANIEQAADTSVSLDTFSAEIDIAFNILVHTWLPESRDAQVGINKSSKILCDSNRVTVEGPDSSRHKRHASVAAQRQSGNERPSAFVQPAGIPEA
jgi:hypothetical protein